MVKLSITIMRLFLKKLLCIFENTVIFPTNNISKNGIMADFCKCDIYKVIIRI
uniref:Uncharacterized protein n=1 Tax=Bartonella schoenbuchensis (strain DSM 13525 / NCTC 13165 / R1) TaxID=687861 RepID=E6Z0U6_BARSR|nr:hypothetical protein BARSC_190005 [Bartonella schoenbuchensis R1]